MNHCPGSSVKVGRISGAKYVIAVAAWLAWGLGSCAGPPDQPLAPAANPQAPAIRQLADEIMVYLSTHNYGRLQAIHEHGAPGESIARALLGPDFHSASLDRWDAKDIHVVFVSNSEATAQVTFFFRRTPNRKPIATVLTFHFRTSDSGQSWQLAGS